MKTADTFAAIEGGVMLVGGNGSTFDVCADVAVVLPDAFVAVSRTRIVYPTSWTPGM